jgi:hypothetical protein
LVREREREREASTHSKAWGGERRSCAGDKHGLSTAEVKERTLKLKGELDGPRCG